MADTQKKRQSAKTYQPGTPPQDLKGLPRFLYLELQKIAVVINSIQDAVTANSV